MDYKTVYVGMALTEAPEAFRVDFQHELKKALGRIYGIEILDFVGLEDGTEVDVYNHDRKCTEGADLCVFIVDHPSIGLGMEIVLREVSGGPLMVFAEEGRRVTRMLTGMLKKKVLPLHRYREVNEIVAAVELQLKRLNEV